MKRIEGFVAGVAACAVVAVAAAQLHVAHAQQPTRTLRWQDTTFYNPQPLSIMFVPNGKTVLTITPEGKFVLGPGATADSAALAIVALAEQYMAKRKCQP